MARTSRGAQPNSQNNSSSNNESSEAAALDDLNVEDLFTDDALFQDLVDDDNMISMEDVALEPGAPPASPASPKRRTRNKSKNNGNFLYGDDMMYLEEEDNERVATAPKDTAIADAYAGEPQRKKIRRPNTQRPAPPPKQKKSKSSSTTGVQASISETTKKRKRGTAAQGQQQQQQQQRASAAVVRNTRLMPTTKDTSSVQQPPHHQKAQQQQVHPLAHILSRHAGWQAVQQKQSKEKVTDETFFPFGPAFPPDLALVGKQRKVLYSVIDSLYTAVSGQQQQAAQAAAAAGTTPPPTSPLSQLLRLTPSGRQVLRNKLVPPTDPQQQSSSSSSATVDKQLLAADLYALAALLQQQYQYMARQGQALQNWCRRRWSVADYQSCWQGPLQELRGQTVTVKILSRSMTVLKLPATRPAVLPPLQDAASTAPSARQRLSSSSKTSTVTTSQQQQLLLQQQQQKQKPKIPPTRASNYANAASPFSLVSELLNTTGRALEKHKQQQRLAAEGGSSSTTTTNEGQQHQSLDTTELWKWITPHYFTVTECTTPRLAPPYGTEAKKNRRKNHEDEGNFNVPPPRPSVTLLDRFASLLVDETKDNDYDDDDDESYSDDDDCLYDVDKDFDRDETLLDLSKLSPEERMLLHVRSLGLLPCDVNEDWLWAYIEQEQAVDDNDSKDNDLETNGTETVVEESSDVEAVLSSMTQGLAELEAVNARRLAFVESLAREYLPHRLRVKKEEEAMLIAQCQYLLKQQHQQQNQQQNSKNKNGDVKARPKVKVPGGDEAALPW